MILTITTKALPLKNRPYILATKPTAAPPTAAGISFWLGNLVPVKWLHTQPMHDTATSKYCRGIRPMPQPGRNHTDRLLALKRSVITQTQEERVRWYGKER